MTTPHVLVVGAGAFGGWTALELVRRGARVTLLDAWGPGHVRATSGGETRVIRAVYGPRAIYTRMAARALRLWRAHDAAFGRGLFGEVCQYETTPDDHFIIDRHPATSNLWMVGGGSGHGFKMGPAVGEIVAAAVLGGAAPDPQFGLARLRRAGPFDRKWS